MYILSVQNKWVPTNTYGPTQHKSHVGDWHGCFHDICEVGECERRRWMFPIEEEGLETSDCATSDEFGMQSILRSDWDSGGGLEVPSSCHGHLSCSTSIEGRDTSDKDGDGKKAGRNLELAKDEVELAVEREGELWLRVSGWFGYARFWNRCSALDAAERSLMSSEEADISCGSTGVATGSPALRARSSCWRALFSSSKWRHRSSSSER